MLGRGKKRGPWRKRGSPCFIFLEGNLQGKLIPGSRSTKAIWTTSFCHSAPSEQGVHGYGDLWQCPRYGSYQPMRVNGDIFWNFVIWLQMQPLLKIKWYKLTIKSITKNYSRPITNYLTTFFYYLRFWNDLHPLDLGSRSVNTYDGICTCPQLRFRWHHVHSSKSATMGVVTPQILTNATKWAWFIIVWWFV